MSNGIPRSWQLIAEHSICHPGRPSPQGDVHLVHQALPLSKAQSPWGAVSCRSLQRGHLLPYRPAIDRSASRNPQSFGRRSKHHPPLRRHVPCQSAFHKINNLIHHLSNFRLMVWHGVVQRSHIGPKLSYVLLRNLDRSRSSSLAR